MDALYPSSFEEQGSRANKTNPKNPKSGFHSFLFGKDPSIPFFGDPSSNHSSRMTYESECRQAIASDNVFAEEEQQIFSGHRTCPSRCPRSRSYSHIGCLICHHAVSIDYSDARHFVSILITAARNRYAPPSRWMFCIQQPYAIYGRWLLSVREKVRSLWLN